MGRRPLASGSVADDGRGFDVDKALDRSGMRLHLGLDAMRERLRLAGGDVEHRVARPARGARVDFADPVGDGTGDAAGRAGRRVSSAPAMSSILSVFGRQILDSRGNPTVEVEVILESGATGRAAVPSGASTGAFEAVELRDGDAARYGGKGVSRRSRTSTTRSPPRSTASTRSTSAPVDATLIELDGTPNKGNLGANAILGVSLAVAKAAADECGLPLYRYVGGTDAHVLPVPMMNVINGGAHADNNDRPPGVHGRAGGRRLVRRGAADGRRDVPRAEEAAARAAASSPRSATRAASRPTWPSNEEAIEVILEAAEAAGHRERVAIALDPAASEFYATAATTWTARAACSTPPRWSATARISARATRSCRSRTAWPRTTGTAGSS